MKQSINNFYYKPKSFCKEYVEIKRDSNQLIQFMATVLGIKKSYDDWFPLEQADKIKEMCKDYKLHYKFDWIFVPCEDVSNIIAGGKRLPTTKMFGFPFTEKSKHLENGSVHVFFSKSKENLELSFKNGWYPLIINNRAIHKPYIDLLRFGYFLGYPDCCIDFFRKYNNHYLYNHLFETLKNTKTKPNIYCNPLLKDHTFSYVYHIPCSYDCKSTINYVSELKREISNLEPGLIKITDYMLKRPFLVFGEQNSYIFNGETKDNSIEYSEAEFAGNNLTLEKELLLKNLKEGNKLKIDKEDLIVYSKNNEIYRQKRQKNEGFILQFYQKNE